MVSVYHVLRGFEEMATLIKSVSGNGDFDQEVSGFSDCDQEGFWV